MADRVQRADHLLDIRPVYPPPVYCGGRYPAGQRAGGGLEVLRAVSKCVAGRISQSAPSRATVAASGLTANLMIGYLNDPDAPRQITGRARRMGPNGYGDQEGTTITLEELIPLTHETGERLDE